jgi:hypothetical protein
MAGLPTEKVIPADAMRDDKLLRLTAATVRSAIAEDPSLVARIAAKHRRSERHRYHPQ